MNKLEEFIKSELARGTFRWTLIRTLVKNGWDKKEATLFANQIAKERNMDPIRLRDAVDRLQLIIVMALLLSVLWVSWEYAARGKCAAIFAGTFWGVTLIVGISGCLIYRTRIKRIGTSTKKTPSQTILFNPTMGNLKITRLYGRRTERIVRLVVHLAITGLLVVALLVLESFVCG